MRHRQLIDLAPTKPDWVVAPIYLSTGIGLVPAHILPHGKNAFVAELRWLPETSVRNRVEDDHIWLEVVYQF